MALPYPGCSSQTLRNIFLIPVTPYIQSVKQPCVLTEAPGSHGFICKVCSLLTSCTLSLTGTSSYALISILLLSPPKWNLLFLAESIIGQSPLTWFGYMLSSGQCNIGTNITGQFPRTIFKRSLAYTLSVPSPTLLFILLAGM